MKRNGVVFEQQDLDASDLCHVIKWRIALWSKVRNESIPYHSAELVRNFGSLHMLFP